MRLTTRATTYTSLPENQLLRNLNFSGTHICLKEPSVTQFPVTSEILFRKTKLMELLFRNWKPTVFYFSTPYLAQFFQPYDFR